MIKEPARLATGFYADIEQLLRRQLAANPAQPDLRLKLIEVYYETGRAADFLREVETSGAALDGSEVNERLRIADM